MNICIFLKLKLKTVCLRKREKSSTELDKSTVDSKTNQRYLVKI